MSGTPMKLILTQEVSGLGAPGDVVEVAGGYGRNYLVPRGLAMRWTRGAEKQIELIKRARSAREIRSTEDARDAANRLASLNVRLQMRAGGGGRLFGSVSTADIAAAVQAAGGRSSTGARSRSRTRSRQWARIRSPSGCTLRSAPRSRSRSSRPDPPGGGALPATTPAGVVRPRLASRAELA